MKTNMIDPTQFSTNHPLSVAMRTTSRYWFLAHSKLMSMQWEWTDAVPYGATDGAKLVLNREGIDKLASKPNGAGLIAFLLVHEALHALLNHALRLRLLADAKTANLAKAARELGWKRVLIIDGAEINENFAKAARNIETIDVLPCIGANANYLHFQLANQSHFVFL
jgi:hypothetical protein